MLRRADAANEKVVIFCHPENVHNLWNADAVLEIIAAHPCVKAYVNGHNHASNYAVSHGVHFLALKGMVDSRHTSYAVVEVHGEHLSILGFGRERDRVFKIR